MQSKIHIPGVQGQETDKVVLRTPGVLYRLQITMQEEENARLRGNNNESRNKMKNVSENKGR